MEPVDPDEDELEFIKVGGKVATPLQVIDRNTGECLAACIERASEPGPPLYGCTEAERKIHETMTDDFGGNDKAELGLLRRDDAAILNENPKSTKRAEGIHGKCDQH